MKLEFRRSFCLFAPSVVSQAFVSLLVPRLSTGPSSAWESVLGGKISFVSCRQTNVSRFNVYSNFRFQLSPSADETSCNPFTVKASLYAFCILCLCCSFTSVNSYFQIIAATSLNNLINSRIKVIQSYFIIAET